MNRYDEYPALAEAIRRAGSMTALAKLIGAKRPSTVSNWLTAKRVPSWYCKAVEDATGVPRIDLRPDLYGAPVQDSAQSPELLKS